MRVAAVGKVTHRPYGKILAGLAIWPFLILFITADNKSFSCTNNLISPTSSFKPIISEILDFKEDSSFTYLAFLMAKALNENYSLNRLALELKNYQGIEGVEKRNGYFVTYTHDKGAAPVVLHFFSEKKMAKAGVYFHLPRETCAKGFVELFSKDAYERMVEKDRAAVRVFFSPEGGCEHQIIEAIRGARSRIDIAMYSFNNEHIANALIEAKRRGVRIRLFMNKSQEHSETAEKLKKSGVMAKFDRKKRGLMHHKFMIVDKQRVYTGSYNWTDNAESMNRENLIILPCLRSFQTEFISLWHRVPRLPANARAPPDPIDAYFSPDGACEDAIIALIRKAKARDGEPSDITQGWPAGERKKIRIALYFFTNKKIAQKLFDAKEHGVDVMLILDKTQRNRGDSVVHYLKQLEKEARKRDANNGLRNVDRGILQIKYHRIDNVTMHNKFAIIGDATITGSYNWTKGAEKYNGENLIILSSPVSDYVAEFDKLKKESYDTVDIDKGERPPYFPRAPPGDFTGGTYKYYMAMKDIETYRVFDRREGMRSGNSHFENGRWLAEEKYVTTPDDAIRNLNLRDKRTKKVFNEALFRGKAVIKNGTVFAYGPVRGGTGNQIFVDALDATNDRKITYLLNSCVRWLCKQWRAFPQR